MRKRGIILIPERFLTIREALTRPPFANVQLVAGAAGLDRQVRWVHILETSAFEKLIHGEEMILTTGIAFRLDKAASVTFVERLIQQNAACLCIEIGPYFQAVSQELIDLADQYGFPLILFPHTVKFVDITQDLHSLIINRHHQTLRELESISREFHRMSLTSQGTLNVLKLLHKSTLARLIYKPLIGSPVFYPAVPQEEQELMLKFIADCWNEWEEPKPNAAPYSKLFGDRTMILKPVGALNQTWSYLIMICGQSPSEYDYLLLDSASITIAQELLRTRYMEERKLFSENLWVDELLSSRLEDEKQIKALVGPQLNRISDLHFRVCLIELENLYDEKLNMPENDWESVRYHLSLILRSTFEKHGYRPFITLKNNRMAVIAVDTKSKQQAKERLEQALQAIRELQSDEKLKDLQLLIGIGKAYSHLRKAYTSHQEALQALSLYSCRRKPVLFYEELGVFQLLLNLNDGRTLQQFIRDYLGPILDYDQMKGSDLLTTLKVYLDHDGSKQIAAQKLFIVRQSLYYRLEKIKELLGEDYMLPENRISIQVALRAYQLLHPEKFGGVGGAAGAGGAGSGDTGRSG